MRKYTHHKWTNQEDHELCRLFHEGLGETKIARAMGKTKNAVKTRIRKYGLYRADPMHIRVTTAEMANAKFLDLLHLHHGDKADGMMP